MPRKGLTPRKTSDTRTKASGKKVDHQETKTGNTELEVPKVNKNLVDKMVQDIFADNENENEKDKEKEKREKRSKLTIPEQTYFDKKYKQQLERKRLEAAAETRKAKKKAHLLELQENADNEKILRMMCDKNGILEKVKTKYTNMVLFVIDILNQHDEDDIKNLFTHALNGLQFLGKEYKNVLNHYTNQVKKLGPPKNPVVEGGRLFVDWLTQMKRDSEAIKKQRNDLYMAEDIDLKLQDIKQNITPQEIDAIKKLIQKKLRAEADKRLHVLAKQNKKDSMALARANRGDMSARSSYGSSIDPTPRAVGNETSEEFEDEVK